jgi:hypothetical protein
MASIKEKFWRWYEKTYKFNLNFAAVVFLLQIIHLLWLSTDVVLHRIFGFPALLENIRAFQLALGVVDYLEIPTIIAVSVIYLRSYQKERNSRALWYLLLLNTQWLHILWITDEFVVDVLSLNEQSLQTQILVWLAIFIDYLEIPVMIDTIKRVLREGKKAFGATE